MQRVLFGIVINLIVWAVEVSGTITPLMAGAIATFVMIVILLTWPLVSSYIFRVCEAKNLMPKLIIMGIIGAATGGAITSAVYWIQQEWDNAAKQKENQRLAEEKIRLSPRLGVRILPSSMEVPGYEYPLERYSLYIENGNTESVPVLDLRIEFNFNNVVVRTTSQIMPGSGEDIADLEIITRSKDGTISSYAEMPR